MNTKVLMAVFRRNFVSYFANPTGYVFICLFVFFGAIAAFWVPEFFGDNLANLDQLSFWFPFIMLVYIPSITMGIWAEERKQGTDELLLTIPAADFDIVLGKYLAAVGIFSVSLLFSLVCNYMVLNNLAATNTVLAVMPTIDLGLFLGTYAGYWLVGVAMLAIGLIASFLTHNITIGFVLGVLFNMPLVFLASADAIFTTFGQQSVLVLKQWSLAQRFDDFSRGILTAAGVAYFAAILVVMLYVSMVLIGRRHWFSGQARWTMAGHYVMRTLALTVIALGVVVVLRQHDVRWDVTNEKLSSLSPHTCELIRDLKVDRPVQIEAFISPSVPESYVQTRLNLLSVLREVKALGGAKVQVQIHDTEAHSREASLAERRYGIEPRLVTTFSHASLSQDQIFLNVAINCGTRKVPPVFVDRGIPIEYELVRSLCTISQQKRKKLGVLTTDAQLYGGMDMQSMQSSPDWPIIEELEKEFELVKVDPAKPLTDKYDVLLAVQPSSLGPAEMDNFLAAVEGGQPTAIFEDPAPVGENIPATSAPRRAGGNPMFMRMQPPAKGDIGKLWKLLGVRFDDQNVIWQNYNPYPKASHFPREFIFIDAGCGAKQPFNLKDPISAGLQQVLLPFPGSIATLNTSDLSFTPLLTTGEKTGTVLFSDIFQSSPFGPRGLNPNPRLTSTNQAYVVAAHIEGKIKAAPAAETPEKAEGDKKDEAAKPKSTTLNVVLVADVDMLMRAFFQLREQGNTPDAGIHFDFDNVTFALNILDELAGERNFVDIRNRRAKHRTLARIEERTESAKQAAAAAREEYTKKYEDEEKKEQKAFEDKIAEIKQRKNVDPQQMLVEVAMMQQDMEREKTVTLEKAKRQKDNEINKSDTELNLEIKRVQGYYKMWAVLLPPIPPLLVALLVFFSRRAREREGVSRSRLR
jgi:ABC-2 type transport system permease protein